VDESRNKCERCGHEHGGHSDPSARPAGFPCGQPLEGDAGPITRPEKRCREWYIDGPGEVAIGVFAQHKELHTPFRTRPWACNRCRHRGLRQSHGATWSAYWGPQLLPLVLAREPSSAGLVAHRDRCARARAMGALDRYFPVDLAQPPDSTFRMRTRRSFRARDIGRTAIERRSYKPCCSTS
jgi:hypothetical protein